MEPTKEPSGGGTELPTEEEKRSLAMAVRQKLGTDDGRYANQNFWVDIPNFDKLLLIAYPPGTRLENREAVCSAIFYDSKLGAWPRSGGAIYQVVIDEGGALDLQYFDRSPITETTVHEVMASIEEQKEQTLALGMNIVSRAELFQLQEQIYRAEPEE